MKTDLEKQSDRAGLLPKMFRKSAERFPADLVDARIESIGQPPQNGGDLKLKIEYTPSGGTTRKTIILGFNEIGMWIVPSRGVNK